MLSRVADSIFWMSRYMERTKSEIKLLQTNYVALQDNAIKDNWKFIVEQYGSKDVLKNNNFKNWSYSDALIYLITDKDNPSSIINNIFYARENARASQDHITKEMWQTLNNFYHFVRNDEINHQLKYQDSMEAMEAIMQQSVLYVGMINTTMDRGVGYSFMSIGRHIEQALQTLKILSVKIKEIDYDITNEHEVTSFRYLLYSLSGYELYNKTYRGELTVQNIINYVLFNPIFTNSVYYALNRIKTRLERIREDSTAEAFNTVQFEVGKILSKFQYSKPDMEDGKKLLLYLEDIEEDISYLSNLFSKFYFGYL